MASSQSLLGMCRKDHETWIILYESVVKLLQKVYATHREPVLSSSRLWLHACCHHSPAKLMRQDCPMLYFRKAHSALKRCKLVNQHSKLDSYL